MIEIKRVIFTFLWVFSLSVTPVSAFDNNEFIPFIDVCSYIDQYNGNKEDLHNLVTDVLNNHHHFQDMSSLSPNATQTGSLRMCDAKYIDDIMYKTFRINTPRPAPEKLMELGYYYNNGFYYYKEREVKQSVKLHEITNIIPMDNGEIYVIFTDTVTTADNSSKTQNSAIKFSRDNSGLFVTAIHMGLDFSNLSEHLKTPSPVEPYIEIVWNALPMAIFILTLTVSIVILYKYVLF